MIRYYKAFPFILWLFLIAGCGRNLKPEDKSRLSEVSVATAVKMPNRPGFLGNTQAIGASFGIVGAVVGAAAASDERDRIQQYLKSQNINMDQIVRSEFIRQLKSHPFFSGKLKDAAKTQFELEIKSYGLVLEPWTVSLYKPVLALDARLIDNTGAVIWEKSESILQNNSSTLSYTYDDYFKSPDKFQKAFEAAAREAVRQLLKKLD